MDEILLTVKGRNGQLELLNDRIRICRRGLLSFLTQGLKGNKEIFYSDITAVQFKLPDLITAGYIQFTFSGSLENKKGIFSATMDENTVFFTPAHKKDFEFAKGEIDRRIAGQTEAGRARILAAASGRRQAAVRRKIRDQLHARRASVDAESLQGASAHATGRGPDNTRQMMPAFALPSTTAPLLFRHNE